MRFGIMALQLEALIPSGASAEQVMANIMSFDHAALVRSLFEQGFNPIELGGDLGMFLPHAYNEAAIERLKALKAEGVSYTVHLPLWSVEPSTPLTPVRRGSVEAVVQLVRASLPLEPEVYVLHATGALAAEFYNMKISEMARTLILRQFQSGARESLQVLLAETGLPSRKVAIETIEFPLDLTLELAEELDLSICLDTGHVLAGFPGWFDFFEIVERVLPRLAEVHIHDSRRMPAGVRGYGEDHKPLGAGDLELGRFLDRLAEANFRGPLVFELKVEEARQSLEVIRATRPALLEV
ncbi:MAG: sugar phosphate isomerase/epimerase [Anaerolineales bacterium]|nr:sugar phosphate isomerase/epimerase [Anaerolineales bacterium]MDW8226627.1 cobamide remodeling phosphodiesterase CbiR [Anaerolineales bacterium]